METKADPPVSFDRVFRWKNNPVRQRLFGRRCRVLEVGSSKLAVLIEFEDGEKVITSRRAIRRG